MLLQRIARQRGRTITPSPRYSGERVGVRGGRANVAVVQPMLWIGAGINPAFSWRVRGRTRVPPSPNAGCISASCLRWAGWLGLGLSLLFALSTVQASEPAVSLTLATTTSTRDSGLLDVLVPQFERQTGIRIKVVAVGSGQALELGRRGDADILLTHAPEAEQEFMKQGFGELRRALMYNDFVLVGPGSDPAKIKGQKSIVGALQCLAEAKSPFVSRGDESGTHQKEKALWKQAAVAPSGDWYISAGSGMAAVLRMANEKQAYTLSDRGTFLAQRQKLELFILSEGDPLLRNPYAVLLVSAAKHPHIQRNAARQFLDFLVSPGVQKTIGEFGVKEFGMPLFFPTADQARE